MRWKWVKKSYWTRKGPEEAFIAHEKAAKATKSLLFEFSASFGSIALSAMGYFLQVMHQAVEEPLNIDFDLAAIGEPVQTLVASQVGKDRLDNGQPPAVDATRFGPRCPTIYAINTCARDYWNSVAG